MANRADRTKYFPLIMAGWLGGSIVLGWLLSFMARPPDLIVSLYSNFEGFVDKYELFCLIMIVAICLMPFGFVLILKYGLGVVSLGSGGWIFFLLSVVFLLIGLGAVGIDGGGKYTQAIRGVVYYLDWLGAVLISFTGLFAFVFFIAILLKNERSH